MYNLRNKKIIHREVYNLVYGEDSPNRNLGDLITVSPIISLGVLSMYKVIPSLSIPYKLLGL